MRGSRGWLRRRFTDVTLAMWELQVSSGGLSYCVGHALATVCAHYERVFSGVISVEFDDELRRFDLFGGLVVMD